MISIPHEIVYSPDHIWINMQDEFIGACGISEYCLEKLQDVVYVACPEINMEVRMGERIGIVESHTDIFSLLAPVSGRIIEINNELGFDPELINTNPLDKGWIFKIE